MSGKECLGIDDSTNQRIQAAGPVRRAEQGRGLERWLWGPKSVLSSGPYFAETHNCFRRLTQAAWKPLSGLAHLPCCTWEGMDVRGASAALCCSPPAHTQPPGAWSRPEGDPHEQVEGALAPPTLLLNVASLVLISCVSIVQLSEVLRRRVTAVPAQGS